MEQTVDQNIQGIAQAWPYTASTTGTVTKISFYVDASNTGQAGEVGLYTDNNNDPGTLMGSASFSPQPGIWNQLSVSTPVHVTAGSRYWLAELGNGTGLLKFRDDGSGTACTSRASKSGQTSLPSAWSTNLVWGYCPASFYATGPSG